MIEHALVALIVIAFLGSLLWASYRRDPLQAIVYTLGIWLVTANVALLFIRTDHPFKPPVIVARNGCTECITIQ